MDLGKIMIGIAPVMLPGGMLVSPSATAVCDRSCTVGCGSATSSADATVTPYSPLKRDKNRRMPGIGLRVHQSWKRTMTPPDPSISVSLGKKPRTRMNDDHSMHIPGISSHRNVNNNGIRPGTGVIPHRHWSGPALTPEYREKQSSL